MSALDEQNPAARAQVERDVQWLVDRLNAATAELRAVARAIATAHYAGGETPRVVIAHDPSALRGALEEVASAGSSVHQALERIIAAGIPVEPSLGDDPSASSRSDASSTTSSDPSVPSTSDASSSADSDTSPLQASDASAVPPVAELAGEAPPATPAPEPPPTKDQE